MLRLSDPGVREEINRLTTLAEEAIAAKYQHSPISRGIGNPHPTTPKSEQNYHGGRFGRGEW